MNLGEHLELIALKNASRPFLIDHLEGRDYSYHELCATAFALHTWLEEHGVKPKERIVISLSNGAPLVLLYFASLMGTITAVPVNPALSYAEKKFILRATHARHLIEMRAGDSLPVLRLVTDGIPDENRSEKLDIKTLQPVTKKGWFKNVDEENIFTVTYTSGTTGTPKGVAHRAGSLFGNAEVFNKTMGFTDQNVFLHVMPMTYMAGILNTLIVPFMAGASLVMTDAFCARSPLGFWEPVMQHGADVFWLSPTMMAALLRADRNESGRAWSRKKVKAVCVGTAPLSPKLRKEFSDRYGAPVYESYGLSELLLVATESPGFSGYEGSVGSLLPGVDADVRPDGEIVVRTPYAAAGYVDPESGEPVAFLENRWCATGDLGRIDATERLFVTDRKKDIIIRGGVNISPAYVEGLLLEHEAIEAVAVLGLPHDFYGEEVVAAVKLRKGFILSEVNSSLVAFGADRIGTPSAPNRFVAVEQFPTGSTGKIQKSRLAEMISGAKP